MPFRHLMSLVRPAFLWWVAAWLPAVGILLCIRWDHVAVPYHDSWVFVNDYRAWEEGHYSWRQFLAPVIMQPAVYGKALYFVVMHWFRGQVTLLMLLSWFLSLGTSLAVCAMSRRIWRVSAMTGAVLMMVVNLVIFSAAQSSAWLVDIIFQNHTPGFCLAVGLWLLSSERRQWGWRLIIAGTLALVAVDAYASGFVVGFLLAPAVWWALGSCQPGRRRLLMGMWGLWVVLLTWLVLLGPAPGLGTLSGASAPETSMNGMGRLLLRCEYVLAVLGSGLGKGFPLDEQIICPIIGGLLILVLAGCLYVLWKRRSQPGLWFSSYPWLAFCAYGLANAAMICFGRMRYTLITALAPRYLMLSGFFVLGLVLLVAELRGRETGKQNTAPSSQAEWPWGPVALSLLAFTLSINWFFGVSTMHWYHDVVLQNRAAMMFADVLPLPQSRFSQLDFQDGTTPGSLSARPTSALWSQVGEEHAHRGSASSPRSFSGLGGIRLSAVRRGLHVRGPRTLFLVPQL